MAGFSAKDLDNLEAGGKGYEQPQSLQRGNGTTNRKGDVWEPDSKRFHDQLPNSAGALCMSAAQDSDLQRKSGVSRLCLVHEVHDVDDTAGPA